MLPAIKAQVQPNRWSCLPTAFAIACGVNLKYVLQYVGHDGSDILWPDEPEPLCRRSFHIQELIDYVWWRGYAVTPFEANPHAVPVYGQLPYKVVFPKDQQSRLMDILKTHRGVITGVARESNSNHAVAWDNVKGRIFNPNGKVQEIDAIAINTFWAFGQGL